jgi:hypothetical protein
LKVEVPSIRPVRSNSCCAPPASAAFGRRGLANRRCLEALRAEEVRASRRVARFVAFGEALRAVERRGARAAGALEAEAAAWARRRARAG